MERVFYDDGSVKVTSARFIASGGTHAMGGILSAAAIVTPPSRLGWITGLLLGIVVLLLAGWSAKVLGLIVAGACSLVLARQKAVHSIMLRSASGDMQAFSGTDGARIAAVLSALNCAMAERGQSALTPR